jgi:hypothetical protein
VLLKVAYTLAYKTAVLNATVFFILGALSGNDVKINLILIPQTLSTVDF